MPKGKRKIVMMSEPPKVYTNFKLFCETEGLVHNTLARKKFPLDINGVKIFRVYECSPSNIKGNESY